MSNNFQVAGPVKQKHPLYRGRTRLVEELLMVCSKPCQYYTIIHGNFRMGKTSLLRHFEHRLEQTDFIKSVLIDLRSQVHANLEQVYGYVAKHIVQKLSTHRFEQKSVRSCDDLARMLSEIMNQSLESCHLALILENLVVLTPPLRAELANTLNWMFNNRWDFPGLERVSIILTGGIEFYKLYIPGLSPLSQSCRAHFLDDLSEADAVNLIQTGLVDFVSLEEEERARLGGWV